ncbi:hypothetical protein Aglo03_41460 [Actinokineospora globicatena]|uniref:Uncharacterized protein n=1 Tax=Actinokineospora globicatena TaxID=103729 RepID=A0A9W6QP25_9PSEU|nr:hypothetical protein Aglo03_41460 [Actinokineospora globicatena]
MNAVNAAITVQEKLRDARRDNTYLCDCSVGISQGKAVPFRNQQQLDYIGTSTDRAERPAKDAGAIFVDGYLRALCVEMGAAALLLAPFARCQDHRPARRRRDGESSPGPPRTSRSNCPPTPSSGSARPSRARRRAGVSGVLVVLSSPLTHLAQRWVDRNRSVRVVRWDGPEAAGRIASELRSLLQR